MLAKKCILLSGAATHASPDDLVASLLAAGVYLPWSTEDRDLMRADHYLQQGASYQLGLAQIAQQVEEAVLAVGQSGWWLKGWASKDLYPQTAWRLMTDLDLCLGSTDAVDRVYDELAKRGFVSQPQRRPWPKNFELVLLSPSGVLVELHRTIGPERFARRVVLPDRAAGLGDLSKAGQLVHAALHCYQHAGRIKAYQWLDAWLLGRNKSVLSEAKKMIKASRLQAVWRFFCYHYADKLGEKLDPDVGFGLWLWYYRYGLWKKKSLWRGPKLIVNLEDLPHALRHAYSSNPPESPPGSSSRSNSSKPRS